MIYVAKTKEVTVPVICAFVFVYSKSRYSHAAAHLTPNLYVLGLIVHLACHTIAPIVQK